jgi:hypothetical protein
MDTSRSEDITRPQRDNRDAAADRNAIDKFVQARMKAYSHSTNVEGNVPAAPKAAMQLASIPGMKVTTQFLVIVRDDVPQCQEILKIIETQFKNDTRFLIKDVGDVKDTLSWLRGIPTLVTIEEERIYEGSAVKLLLNHLLADVNNVVDHNPRPIDRKTNNIEYAAGPVNSRSKSSSLAQLYGVEFKTDMSKYNGTR